MPGQAAGSPVSDLMEGDRSVINFDHGQEPAAHVLINGPWECGWCWFLSNISGGPLSYNKWPVNITPCAPPGEEGEGGQFGIHPGSYCCHLICFVWVCPLLAIAGHLSYHVPMFDMTINSQQF